MTTLAYALSDSRVMLRRNLKHQLRYPSMTVMLVGLPIVLLLLFVYVFGGQLGAGLGVHEGRSAYLNYVVPGLLLITVASVVQGTSIMVAMDMTGGIIDRFRTMAIARASVLTGHVLGSLIQTLAAMAILGRLRPRVSLQRRTAPLVRRDRDTGPVRLRSDLAGCRARAGGQERRDRQQHPDDPAPAAVPQQWLRVHRHHASRPAPVR
jgi:ABC-2 type transport system permease protein